MRILKTATQIGSNIKCAFIKKGKFNFLTKLPKKNDTCEIKPAYNLVFDLLQTLTGTLAKEDVKRVAQISKKFKDFSSDEIKQKLVENADDILNRTKTSDLDLKEESNILFYSNKSSISEKFKDEIKEIELEQVALNNILDKRDSKNIVLFPTNSSVSLRNMNKKIIPMTGADDIIEHPRDMGYKLIGNYTADDEAKILGYEKKYQHLKTNEVLKTKNNILNKIADHTEKEDCNYFGKFSRKELNKLKNLIIQYDSLNNIQKRCGVFTKDLEQIAFNKTRFSQLKSGDKLANMDIIIGNSTVYDKTAKSEVPTITMFSDSAFNYRLKTYKIDENFEKECDNITLKYNTLIQNTNVDELNELNTYSSNLLNQQKNNAVSEVYFTVHDKEIMKHNLMNRSKIPSEKIDEILGDDGTFTYISRLKDFDTKKYYNVSKKMVATLEKILKGNGLDNTVIIEALAFNGSKHSPVALYLRYGFEPISHTKESIENIILNPKEKFDYKDAVWLLYRK